MVVMVFYQGLNVIESRHWRALTKPILKASLHEIEKTKLIASLQQVWSQRPSKKEKGGSPKGPTSYNTHKTSLSVALGKAIREASQRAAFMKALRVLPVRMADNTYCFNAHPKRALG